MEIGEAITQATSNRETNTKHAKVIVLGVISFLLISLVWWLLSQALYGGSAASWAYFAVASMFWVSFISFFVIINPHKWIFGLNNVWGLVAYLIFLPKDIYVILGGVLFFLLSLLFQRRIETEQKNQQHFSIRRTISGSVLIATYAFLFVIGFNLYYHMSEDLKNNPQKFYDRVGETASKGIPFLSNNLPGIDLNQPLDDYILKRAEQSLPQEIRQGPDDVKQSYIQGYKDQFLKNLGVNSEDNETIAAAMTRLLEQRSREYLGRYESFFPLIFTLIVVGLLRTFAFIYNWLSIFVGWLLFRFLLAIKFFKIKKAMVEIDKLDV